MHEKTAVHAIRWYPLALFLGMLKNTSLPLVWQILRKIDIMAGFSWIREISMCSNDFSF